VSCLHIKDKMSFPNLSKLDLCKTVNISAPSPPQQHSAKAARQDPDAVIDIVELFDKLGFDGLELMLEAIGETDKSKEGACNDAIHALCDSHPKIREICDSNPNFWIKLTKRIFKLNPPEDFEGNPEVYDTEAYDINGRGLIYRTFRDDTSPRNAFVIMCKAESLADALAKRFACFAITKYEENLWELWSNHDDNVIENDGYDDMTEQYEYHMANYQEIAAQTFPAIEHTHLWLVMTERDFNKHPSKNVYLKKYEHDSTFKRVVNNLLNSVGAYLFENEAFIHNITPTGVDVDKQLEIIHQISKVLGIYSVCLWKHWRDIDVTEYVPELTKKTAHAKKLLVAVARAIDLILGKVTKAQIDKDNNEVEYDSELLSMLVNPSIYREAWVNFEKGKKQAERASR